MIFILLCKIELVLHGASAFEAGERKGGGGVPSTSSY
jgi:hypothetical protein